MSPAAAAPAGAAPSTATGRPGIALDADGTIWSGDVGEDTFHAAVAASAVREAAVPALLLAARRLGRTLSGSPSDLAAALLEEFARRGQPERQAFEMIAQVWAGWAPDEARAFAADALSAADLAARVRPPVIAVVDWARRRGVAVCVVSASPQPAVEAALELAGLAGLPCAAMRPAVRDGRFTADLVAPVPYGAGKVAAWGTLQNGHRRLAAFGDSGFDADMLRSAEQAVAVRPDDALRRLLADVPGAVELAC